MKLIESIAKQKVLILGFAREGVDTFLYLRKKFPQKEIAIADQTPFKKISQDLRDVLASDRRVIKFFGGHYLDSLKEYDVIIKSSGIKPHIPEVADATPKGKLVTSQMQLFFEECKGKIIGITGTKGKSTTSSVIYSVLKAGGKDVHLAGNIGVPVLSMLHKANANTLFVLELSSYQLMGLRLSPHIAVVQNIVQEHIDYHKTFEAYVNAKRNIVHFQNEADVVIYNASHTQPKEFASLSKAKKIPFSSLFIEDNGCFLEDDNLVYHHNGKQQIIMPAKDIPLKGVFNIDNVMPAIIVGKLFCVSKKDIVCGIKHFIPLEHRLEFVGKRGDISFYNDSLCTVPEAAIAAIKSFGTSDIVLIAGGFDRDQNYKELAQEILTHHVHGLVLFPTTGTRIWNEVIQHVKVKHQAPQHAFVEDMKSAVHKAFEMSGRKGVILLSPASPSFGLFKDYADRGKQFKEEIKKLRIV